jgi:radical SAM superfamily enzyme YgiQ (UPF0313 family)
MTDVVLLNDVFSSYDSSYRWSFWSRYLGPYTVKQSIVDKTLCDCVVVDYFTKHPNLFEYLKNFVDDQTKYIGIATTFLQHKENSRVNDFNLWFTDHEETYQWFKKLKELAPNAKIIIGGWNAEIWYNHYTMFRKNVPLPKAMQLVDYIIKGYAEAIVPNIINNNTEPQQIIHRNGVNFVSDNTSAGAGAQVNPVKWSSVDNVVQGEWLPLEVSKGCRFGCKFCMFDKLGTTIIDKDALREELIHNYKEFGVTGYQLTDDTINDSMEKVQMVHEVFTSLPFKAEWIAYARPDMFEKFPQMLDLMYEAGCRGMFLGIETFNYTAAKLCGKGLHPEKIKNILSWIKEKYGDEIFVLGSFILGLPGETEESLEDTLQYLKNQDVIDKILFEVFYVRPSETTAGNQKDYHTDNDKYEIRNIQFSPYYWEHGTLNYNQCQEISSRWKQVLTSAKYSGHDRAIESSTNFWSYPRMRSLGYDHHQSFRMLKDASMPDELYTRNNKWIEDYYKGLVSHEQTISHTYRLQMANRTAAETFS